MATAFSASYNGLSFGQGGTVGLTSINQIVGINDMPSVRTADMARPASDGEFQGIDYLGGRTVQLEILVQGTSQANYDALCDQVEGAFSVQSQELPLSYTLGDTSQVRRINCRPRKVSIPRDPTRWGMSGLAAVELHATDPRKYDGTQQTLPTGLPSATGGFGFPFGFPFGFGGAGSGGIIQAVNAGNYPAPALLTIAGPCANPIVSNDTLGKALKFLITLGASDVLTVELDMRLVTLNQTANRNNVIDFANQGWFLLQPGNNTIRFNANAYTAAAQLTVAFRSAWS